MITRRDQRGWAMRNGNPDLPTLMRHYGVHNREVHNRSDGKSPDAVPWCNGVLNLFLHQPEARLGER